MADRTVGFGKTYASIAAGLAAAADGDNVIVSAQNANGDYVYFEANLVMGTANVTLKSDIPGTRFTIWTVASSPSVKPSAAGTTIRDVNFIKGSRGVDATHTTGVLTIDRCIFFDNASGSVVHLTGAGDMIVNNCMSLFSNYGYYGAQTNIFTCNFCLSAFAATAGYQTFAAVGTAILNNCLSYFDTNDFSTLWDGGDTNATSQASGAPGNNPIYNISKANTKFAYYHLPAGASLFPFWDLRTVDGVSSVLEDAGTVVSGVTTDIDNRTRDESTPNVGPTEGFIGFAAALPAAPAQPVLVFVSRSTGQVTLAVTGDAGVTNQLMFRTTGAFQNGVTRSGNGNLVQTGLSDGTVYEFLCIAQN